MDAPTSTVHLRWTPRPREYADAQLARSAETSASSTRWWVVIALAVLGGLLIPVQATTSVGIALLVVALVPAFARQRILARRHAAMFAGNPSLGDTVDVLVSDDGVQLTAERWSSRRSWAVMTSWTDAPHAWVLSTSDTSLGHLLPLPKQAVADPRDADRIRALLERHLGPPLGASRRRVAVLPWIARAVLVAAVVVPLTIGFTRTHSEGGEWRMWPSEAPPLLDYQGFEYVRIGDPIPRPQGVPGTGYTPGGGLVLAPLVQAPSELWVLEHDGDVFHYVAALDSGPRT